VLSDAVLYYVEVVGLVELACEEGAKSLVSCGYGADVASWPETDLARVVVLRSCLASIWNGGS
jgi:hypothetical protein